MHFADTGQAEVASNVLWYELDAQGNPTYTDGFTVYDSRGKKRLVSDELVSSLTLAPSSAVSGA
jgi:hypothetical protein